eukprot:1153050-Pelagomonas_calceolata.AAC.14
MCTDALVRGGPLHMGGCCCSCCSAASPHATHGPCWLRLVCPDQLDQCGMHEVWHCCATDYAHVRAGTKVMVKAFQLQNAPFGCCCFLNVKAALWHQCCLQTPNRCDSATARPSHLVSSSGSLRCPPLPGKLGLRCFTQVDRRKITD